MWVIWVRLGSFVSAPRALGAALYNRGVHMRSTRASSCRALPKGGVSAARRGAERRLHDGKARGRSHGDAPSRFRGVRRDHRGAARPRRLPVGSRADASIHSPEHDRGGLRGGRRHRGERRRACARRARRRSSAGGAAKPDSGGRGRVRHRRRVPRHQREDDQAASPCVRRGVRGKRQRGPRAVGAGQARREGSRRRARRSVGRASPRRAARRRADELSRADAGAEGLAQGGGRRLPNGRTSTRCGRRYARRSTS